jgi:hypothetical protein
LAEKKTGSKKSTQVGMQALRSAGRQVGRPTERQYCNISWQMKMHACRKQADNRQEDRQADRQAGRDMQAGGDACTEKQSGR